ncbi:hypothetical protein K1719_020175 [Acacia pycnantha]|nr:hypothetical protein K1719_020175 [Acacia pycnantha]
MKMVPSVGRLGEITAFWKNNSISVIVLEEDRQILHFHCVATSMSQFIFTAVYALPHSNFHFVLWAKLQVLSSSISLPWVICGDFNVIMSQSERVGRGYCNLNRVRWFQNRAFDNGLNGHGSSTLKYTWKGLRLRGCQRLFQCLDRALANEDFLSTFIQEEEDRDTVTKQVPEIGNVILAKVKNRGMVSNNFRQERQSRTDGGGDFLQQWHCLPSKAMNKMSF